MKQIQGKPVNIGEDIVGRITFGKNVFQRSNEILVYKNASTSAFGYVATITTKETIADNGKPCCVVNDINDLLQQKKPLQIMESLVVWSMTLTTSTREM